LQLLLKIPHGNLIVWLHPASVSAIPTDRDMYGYLSEHHSFGETEDQAGEYAEEFSRRNAGDDA